LGVIRYDITEQAFNQNSLPLTELSILTGMDSSSYLITDPQANALAIRALSHPAQEKWWTADERLTSANFSKVRLAWQSRRFTLIPARLYDGEKRATFLSTLTSLASSETVLADPIPKLDAFLVYALDHEQLTSWRRTFVGCRFYHALTPILSRLAQESTKQARPVMYAYFRDGNLYTIAIDRNQLLFCNGFQCPEAKDSLYYILLTYQQCDWKTSQVPLFLFGEVMPDAAVYQLLFRYVRNLSFLEGSNNDALKWGATAHEHPTHLFYDLGALQQYQ
jgi:hypothetical protein